MELLVARILMLGAGVCVCGETDWLNKSSKQQTILTLPLQVILFSSGLKFSPLV